MRVVINGDTVFEGTELECDAVKSAIELLGKANDNLVLSIESKYFTWDNPTFDLVYICTAAIDIKP